MSTPAEYYHSLAPITKAYGTLCVFLTTATSLGLLNRYYIELLIPRVFRNFEMLSMDVIFGSPLMPDLMGIIAGHLYYFLIVLHPLAGGRNMLKTPLWVQKLVTRYRIGSPEVNTRVQRNPTTGGAFSGRSYRVGQ